MSRLGALIACTLCILQIGCGREEAPVRVYPFGMTVFGMPAYLSMEVVNTSTSDVTVKSVSGLSHASASALFSNMVENQAVMLATNDFYATATLLILLPIGIIWLVDPPKGPLTRVTGH